jgi:AcrR family transcriptional regulator
MARALRTRPATSRKPASGQALPSRRRADDATARGAPLTRERIVAAALALVERDGPDDFSLRKLGAALGREAMSLYHHFPSKAHLLDALVDAALEEILVAPVDGDPLAALRAVASSYRAMARRHPKLYPLIAVHRLNTPTGVRLIERVLSLVRAAIRDDALAARHFRVLGYYLTGAALDETAGYAQGPSAAEPVSDDYVAAHCPQLAAAAPYFKPAEWERTFALGLEALLNGMRAPLGDGASPPQTLPAPKPVIRPKR